MGPTAPRGIPNIDSSLFAQCCRHQRAVVAIFVRSVLVPWERRVMMLWRIIMVMMWRCLPGQEMKSSSLIGLYAHCTQLRLYRPGTHYPSSPDDDTLKLLKCIFTQLVSGNQIKIKSRYWRIAARRRDYNPTVITSSAGAVTKYCDEYVCLWVSRIAGKGFSSPIDNAYISGTTHAIFTNFYACCLCPWLSALPTYLR